MEKTRRTDNDDVAEEIRPPTRRTIGITTPYLIKSNHTVKQAPALLQDFRNILIIKPSSLGDVVRSAPLFHGLRDRYPHATISWVIRPDCAPLLDLLPGLHEPILFDRRTFARMGRSLSATRALIAFLRNLRNRRFDLVLDLQGLFRSGFFSRATAAPLRLGFAHAREMAPIFYTHRIACLSGEHVVESLWRFADCLGFGQFQMRFDLTTDPAAEANARDILHRAGLSADDPYTVMLPGGSECSKRWSPSGFGRLADGLRHDYHLPTVLLGAGETERQIAQEVGHVAQGGIVNLIDQTSLPQLTAILKSARLVVGNDSGPLHIAAALGVPLVALYGPTDPRVVGPFGHSDGVVEAGAETPRTARYSRRLEHRIDAITPQQITRAIDKKLCRN